MTLRDRIRRSRAMIARTPGDKRRVADQQKRSDAVSIQAAQADIATCFAIWAGADLVSALVGSVLLTLAALPTLAFTDRAKNENIIRGRAVVSVSGMILVLTAVLAGIVRAAA